MSHTQPVTVCDQNQSIRPPHSASTVWKRLWDRYVNATQEACDAVSALEELEKETEVSAPTPPIEIRKVKFSDALIGVAHQCDRLLKDYDVIDEEFIRKAFCEDRDKGILGAEAFRQSRISMLEKYASDLEDFNEKTGLADARNRINTACDELSTVAEEICQTPANCIEAIACKLGIWRYDRFHFTGQDSGGLTDFNADGDVAVYRAYEDAMRLADLPKHPEAAKNDSLGAMSADIFFRKRSR